MPRDLIEARHCARRTSAIPAARARPPTSSASRSALRRALAPSAADGAATELLQPTRRPSCWSTEADEKVYNIVHLIYRAKSYEGASKDYEFSRLTMEEHWASGYNDAVADARAIPKCCERPTTPDGVATFDLAETATIDRPTPTEQRARP